ncbi:putative glycolipid-binding domain-containing protein [Tianweitania sediminis]|uniref:Putative glycolipid-binding domain-containing protein n=1 Tax=Tianweitania sediminis TaxID=1502156 RepID=A0A8J7RSZ2_9HYPH|nr:putative glycolipid-binding domain-containing protein [Tianweitania sediminis]MBP0441489.1 putative glycolipid-binding domain-containing protein [Tianweitania sediminis]
MIDAAGVRLLKWQSADGTGLEACAIRADGTEFLAEGVIVAPQEGGFAARYGIRFDGAWRTLSVSVALLGAETSLLLSVDAEGKWTREGTPMPELNYAIAPDISATPLTNTFAIRRLNLAEGESADIQVAYITMPDLTVHCGPQRYTCLNKDALYRFESLDSDFKRDIAVDRDGFVLDYPDLFRRVS